MPISKTLEANILELNVNLFRALADPHRLRIIESLGHEVRCNCHLQEMLGLASNHLSYHLKVLREAGLIVGQRRGRWVDYSIAPGAKDLIESALPSLDVVTTSHSDEDC
jgi:ArsR family transcriptional regulator, arsenate/arsenite/antimonite-responsive transcriptional repressor